MAAESPRVFRIFVASPGDVVPEREIAFGVIDELNKSIENLGYQARLKRLSWEESVHAGPGLPQEVIKEQISFETTDIVIGILWKRLGTPTKTNNPEDGSPYLSGTQQEIEESYRSWKSNAYPYLMLYRKVNDVPASMSKEDRAQFIKLNEFLDQFQPDGKLPALIKEFREGEFRELLRRELEQRIRGMMGTDLNREKRSVNSPTPGENETKNSQPVNQRESASIGGMSTWLRDVKLSDNPFLHQDAEHDDSLPAYFTRFPDLYAVTTSDLTFERKSWFFFGKDGSGKTALRKFIAARGRPIRSDSNMVCIEYDQVKFEELLSNTNDLGDFQVSFVQSIFDALTPHIGNAIQSSQPPASLRGNLNKLSVELREYGISWVLCLIDPGWPVFEWKGSKVETSTLITPLFSLSEVGGYGFRYFLPDAMKNELEPTFSNFPFNHIRIKDIRWDEKTLKDMLGRRMTQLSVDQLAPYRSLGELCEDEMNLSTLIDSEIASLAQGNPRAAIWLANSLIERHCEVYPTPPRITSETWNNVKWAWWLEKESEMLGPSGSSGFRVLSDRLFYQNKEIILLERSDRLLKSLILTEGGFSSKQELIKAGWIDEKNLEGISEKALSEAMRRMKEELKKELQEKGFKPFDCFKSVRGRGYRLLQPGVSQNGQEGRND